MHLHDHTSSCDSNCMRMTALTRCRTDRQLCKKEREKKTECRGRGWIGQALEEGAAWVKAVAKGVTQKEQKKMKGGGVLEMYLIESKGMGEKIVSRLS